MARVSGVKGRDGESKFLAVDLFSLFGGYFDYLKGKPIKRASSWPSG